MFLSHWVPHCPFSVHILKFPPLSRFTQTPGLWLHLRNPHEEDGSRGPEPPGRLHGTQSLECSQGILPVFGEGLSRFPGAQRERRKQFCYRGKRRKRRWSFVKKTKKTNHKHWDHPKDFLNCFGCCSSLIHCRFHGSVLWQHFYMFGLKKERELACERYILSIQYCKYRKLNCFISKLCHLCSCTLPRIHNHWYNWMKDDI